MKTLACIALVLGTLAAPASGFAQSNTPLTRAQVRADLVRVERAGYNPAPETILGIRRTSRQPKRRSPRSSRRRAASAARRRTAPRQAASAFTRLRASASCVGPASFCNSYFGS
jgi:hypothetical protein